MGNADRIIRLIIAVLVVAFYFSGILSGTVAIVLLVLAGIFVFTSIAGFCPVYAVFGLNTCPKTHTRHH